MFEVIICTVNTGRVQRKLFDTRDRADRHAERWLARACRKGGSASRYRVEVYHRPLPDVRPLPRPAVAPAA
jgi:hypothetical protein